MRLGALFVVTVVLAALAVVQPSAGSRSRFLLRPAARTIATAPHFVTALAQDGSYIAWGPTEPRTKQGCEKEVVVVQDLRTGRSRQVPVHPASNCLYPGVWGLALAGSRAYWMRTTSLSNEGEIDRVVSSSLSDLKPRLLGGEETKPQNNVLPQPPVSDGKRAYFWSGSESGGRILRMQGLERKTFSPLVPPPAALAAADGKEIAYVRHAPRQLWLVNADGTDPHQIAAHGWAPDWSPDGTKLVYGAPNDKVVVATQTAATRRYSPAAKMPPGHRTAVHWR